MIKLGSKARPGFVMALAVAVLSGPIAGTRPTSSAAQEGRVSLEGATGWINTDGPIHLEKLRGKVVLLDFWTYCCINCHHVLPDLAYLEKKYKNQLVVIGVHTGKFDAEKNTDNIRAKVHEYQIHHPVANDANEVIQHRFNVSGWPNLVVINANGERVKPDFVGEGHGAELDALIGGLIARHKSRGELDETPIEFPSESDKSHDAALLYPGKVTADAASNRLFISDTGHNRIVVTDLTGKRVDVIGNGKPGLTDGDFKSATFNRPQGTCLFEGVLYVADTENHALRVIDLRERTVKTIAGTGQQGRSYTASGKGTATPLSSPWDVIVIPGTKNLAIAMAGLHQIWRYDLVRGTISHWAGSGHENLQDGTLATSRFAQPSGLATDGQHLFVADSEVSGVRTINLNSQHHVGTIVGAGLFDFGDKDGKPDEVRLQHCLGLAFGDGKLYIADTYNNKIKVCDPRTRTVKTLNGTSKNGPILEDWTFNEPGGLSLAGSTLFVADTNNHQIRAIDLDSREAREARTLDLSSVEPPAQEKAYKFTNPTVFNVGSVETLPTKELTLDVELVLPPGYKLSGEAPLVYVAEADRPGILASDVSGVIQKVDQPTNPLRIKLPLAKPSLTGSSIQLKLSLSTFVCLPNSLCTVKNYAWNVPITFNPGNPVEIKLTTAKQ